MFPKGKGSFGALQILVPEALPGRHPPLGRCTFLASPVCLASIDLHPLGSPLPVQNLI